MGFIKKLFSLIFKDEDNEWNEDFSYNHHDGSKNDSDGDYDFDSIANDEDGISDSELSVFQDSLERFYDRLSENELEDEALNEAIEKIQEDYFNHKIKDPGKALNAAYQRWKSSKPQREQERKNYRAVIIDMLRRFDDLSSEERNLLIDPCGPYWVNRLKSQDSDQIREILKTWFDNKLLDDDKYLVINEIIESEADCSTIDADKYYDCLEEVPLTEEDYRQRIVIFKNDDNAYDDYLKYAEYFQRYWLESGNKPEPIACHDLIVNRPCYLKTDLLLVSPHFQMGRRYFERDSFQEVTVYLFADALEYISDGGHSVLKFSDIIEIGLNNWSSIGFRIEELKRRKEYGDHIDGSEWPDPQMLEITQRSSNKTLFSYGNSQEKVNLLIMRALIYYFRFNKE